MVFSMHALKRNNTMSFFKIIKTYSIVLLLSISSLTFAKNIDIKSTHAYKENSIYYIDTLYEIKLTEEADKALHHGIPLEIHTLFQLRLKRKWLWDKTVSDKKIIYKLEHRPLTNNFLVINLNTGLRHSYLSLDAALLHINTISKMKLFDQNILDPNKTYVARIKTFLDTNSLPPPLRPQAYFSKKWDVSSEWFEWNVKQ
jgi:uncharacterized protein DUF4390